MAQPPRPSSAAGRLPTISASQALLNVGVQGPQRIATGLQQLDAILTGVAFETGPDDQPKGLLRGQVAEIYGPPGSGKTAFAVELCARALAAGDCVVWIDGSSSAQGSRLRRALAATLDDDDDDDDDEAAVEQAWGRLVHRSCASLAHLLATLKHTPVGFPPTRTSLVVVESLSTLLDVAYPRNVDTLKSFAKPELSRWATGRRNAVISELSSLLSKFAAVYNTVVLVTSQTMTRMRGELAATLRPAMTNLDWDNALSTRIVLCRDWGQYDATQNIPQGIHFAGVIKCDSRRPLQAQDDEWLVPFRITDNGLEGLAHVRRTQLTNTMAALADQRDRAASSLKRPISELESADRQPRLDEYGWAEDDEDHLAKEGLIDDFQAASELPRHD